MVGNFIDEVLSIVPVTRLTLAIWLCNLLRSVTIAKVKQTTTNGIDSTVVGPTKYYNPFAYIHSEKDILKLVTTLIAKTKGRWKSR